MSKFSVGDRVVCTVNHPDGHKAIVIGTTGTVVGLETCRAKVRWDFSVPQGQSHSCGGRCENGYGWNVFFDDIEFEGSSLPEIFQRESSIIDSFLFGGAAVG